ncbi:hypothetical protein [Halobacteriaceae bacterium SHR40]|uniref:hypothetical protein n=1 Tax=Halovenus amylolytica TaxID=2500550 RepID=UPI000FE351BC
MSIIEHANRTELVATLPFSVWTDLLPELTAAIVFPIVLGSLLVLASVTVTVRSVRSVGRQGTLREYVPVVGLLVGSLGVFGSLLVALDQPASIPAFLAGAVGAVCCYATVLPALVGNGRQTVALQAVAVLSILWIAGFLAVGATASGGTGHYELAALLGVLSIAVPVVRTGVNRPAEDRLATPGRGWAGWLLLGAAFLLPTTIGAVFGEEVLFVAYLAATVVGSLLWWFSRLAGY